MSASTTLGAIEIPMMALHCNWDGSMSQSPKKSLTVVCINHSVDMRWTLGCVELSKEEEKGRRKELNAYCGRLIEDYEDDLVTAIRNGFDEASGNHF